jgi:hypothetical protein
MRPLKQGATLVTKLADPLYLQSDSTPFYIQIECSLKPDAATLIWIDALFVLYKHVSEIEINQLRFSSRHVNKSFIIPFMKYYD